MLDLDNTVKAKLSSLLVDMDVQQIELGNITVTRYSLDHHGKSYVILQYHSDTCLHSIADIREDYYNNVLLPKFTKIFNVNHINTIDDNISTIGYATGIIAADKMRGGKFNVDGQSYTVSFEYDMVIVEATNTDICMSTTKYTKEGWRACCNSSKCIISEVIK